jgi:hypothetical protein
VGLGLGLLAALQAYLGISDVLTITVICAAFTLLIGLILIFSPPTRDYLPLIALVCSLISYTFAAYLAVQYHIIESIVFLHAQESEPKRLGDAKALAPPSRFVLSLDGRDWEIGKEIHGKVEHIVKLKRKHERWVETHELLGYVNYLRDPVKHRWVGRLLDLLPIGEAARISNRHLFIGKRIGRDWPKPGEPCALSPIDCLAALELAPESGVRPDWTMPMLKAWTSKVTEALKSDLRWRWRDESIGSKLHIALSAAIGFFLALAALIAWQIRSATEASPRPHTGWQ